jgi:hypothetical protein
MNLWHLTDIELLKDTKLLVKGETNMTLKVLHHLREIERRRLFSDLGYGSLFDYTVKELGYSEPAALRRINSARSLAITPDVEKKLASGTLSLTNLSMAAQLFKNEDISDKTKQKAILQEIEGKTKRECEKVLMQFIPPVDLPKEGVKRVTPDYHCVKMNWSEETFRRFQRLKSLHAHKRLDQDNLCGLIFEIALKDKVNAKLTTPAQRQSGNTRYVPRSLQRYIRKRDNNECQVCKGNYKLEFDHIQPFALGGLTNKENLRLLCQSCNQRQRIKAKL